MFTINIICSCIKKETLADSLVTADKFDNIYDINGIELGIKLEKN